MMNSFIKISALGLVLVMLTACSSSGDSNATNVPDDESNPSPPDQQVNQLTFSLQLNSIEVHRVSNGATITVDTAAINSGELTYQ